jgi:hypothetical protein
MSGIIKRGQDGQNMKAWAGQLHGHGYVSMCSFKLPLREVGIPHDPTFVIRSLRTAAFKRPNQYE